MLLQRRKPLVLKHRLKRRTDKQLQINPIRKAYPWYWRYIEGRSDICYVCDRQFRSKSANKYKVYVGVHPFNGAKLFRHRNCHPQTDRWRRKFGDNLEFRNKLKKWKEKKIPTTGLVELNTSSFLNDDSPKLLKRRNHK